MRACKIALSPSKWVGLSPNWGKRFPRNTEQRSVVSGGDSVSQWSSCFWVSINLLLAASVRRRPSQSNKTARSSTLGVHETFYKRSGDAGLVWISSFKPSSRLNFCFQDKWGLVKLILRFMYLVQSWQGVCTCIGPTPQNTVEILIYIVLRSLWNFK